MLSKQYILYVTVATVFATASAFPAIADARAVDSACITDVIADADDSMTVGELRTLCGKQLSDETRAAPAKDVPVYEQSAFEERFGTEAEERPFQITPHQPNYLMWSTLDDPNVGPFLPQDPNAMLEDNEMVFQLSIKVPLWRNMFGSDIDGYFGYTTKSYWQLFNDEFSAPFRETNYQPELFIRKFKTRNFLGMSLLGWDLSLNHESNGRTEPLSRSWDRVMGRLGLQVSKDLTVLGRAWWRIPEDDDEDDNPNMYRYYGYGDLRAIWTPKRNTFTALLRPGTEEFSYEVTWSYPISRVFRIYALYYNGYGENLLDYNVKNERFGIGIALNDFLGRN